MFVTCPQYLHVCLKVFSGCLVQPLCGCELEAAGNDGVSADFRWLVSFVRFPGSSEAAPVPLNIDDFECYMYIII